MPTEIIILEKFILSILLGGLIGIERERNLISSKIKNFRQKGFGGIRTYMLISLLGALSSYLGQNIAPIFYALGFILFGLLLAESYIYYAFKLNRAGATSEIGAIITYLIGVSCFGNDLKIPIIATIITTIIFSLKKHLHRFAYQIHNKELYATLKFAIIAFIVLPYLPKTSIDPWGMINLYKIWTFVVIISGITFLGYILNKIIGVKKGLFLTGFIGGLISSTSVVSSLSKNLKNNNSNLIPTVSACIISYLASILKVALEILIINFKLFLTLIIPIICMVLIGFSIVLLINRNKTENYKHEHKINFDNPFTLKFALIFGLVLTTVFILSQLAMQTWGSKGIFITALLAGIAKIDAIAVSMAELGGKEITYSYASIAILIGFFFSALSKTIYSLIFGNKKIAIYLAITLTIISTIGLGTSILI
ncbi:hypothetical protein A2229_05005 [Candidatus Peregrinibacteria bacterium RIFOXYA2_FULL_33_7]|nr:MAG: hypothetical protein A2229_05005 [Candidatus Peregrinibacteria bacterium RIFOXYA2_FULL_33_7]